MYADRVVGSYKFRKKMGWTDGQIDGRQNVTLRLPLDAASVAIRS